MYIEQNNVRVKSNTNSSIQHKWFTVIVPQKNRVVIEKIEKKTLERVLVYRWVIL